MSRLHFTNCKFSAELNSDRVNLILFMIGERLRMTGLRTRFSLVLVESSVTYLGRRCCLGVVIKLVQCYVNGDFQVKASCINA